MGFVVLALCVASRSGAERFEDPELNFAFDTPTQNWVRVPPQEAARLMLVRRNPSMRFHIVGQDTRSPAELSDEEQLARSWPATSWR